MPGWKSTPKSALSSSGFLHSSFSASVTRAFDNLVLRKPDVSRRGHSSRSRTHRSIGAYGSSDIITISPWNPF